MSDNYWIDNKNPHSLLVEQLIWNGTSTSALQGINISITTGMEEQRLINNKWCSGNNL